MSTESGVAEALRASAETFDVEPDVVDLMRRRDRLERRRRGVAVLVGLTVAAGGIIVAAALLDVRPSGNGVPRATGSLRPGSIELSPGDVPEGRLVVQAASSVEVLDAGAANGVVVSRGLHADDVAPDGSSVVVVAYEGERETLLVVDLETGEERVVAKADPGDLYAQPEWSPDSHSIAFVGRQGEAPDVLCVVEVESRVQRCFPDSGRVYSLDWAPDGQTVVVAGPPDQPVRLVNVESGETVPITEPGGDTGINRAIQDAALGRGVQLVDPVWSPTGRYLAALVSLEGSQFIYVPVVFTPDGDPIALGKASSEFPEGFGWSPASDTLAYTQGTAPYRITEVRLLDPVSGRDQVLLEGGPGDPQITDLVWSPSGRWLAVARWDWLRGIPELQEVRILSVLDEEPPRHFNVDFGEITEPLVGWSPAPGGED